MSESERKILGLLQHNSPMSIEILVFLLPQFSWKEIFSALKRLAKHQIIYHSQDGAWIDICYMGLASPPHLPDDEHSKSESTHPTLEMPEFQKVG